MEEVYQLKTSDFLRKWKNVNCTGELIEYLARIQNDQIIITSLWENSQKEIVEKRRHIVNWIFYVCEILNFDNETAFKTIALLNLYLSESGKKQQMTITDSSAEFQLIAVTCLNIATKLEEINCSYMKFLTEKVLNVGSPKQFTVKEMALKEIEILRVLKFRTSFPTMYDVNNIFLQIVINEISSSMNNVNKCLNICNDITMDLITDPYFPSYLIQANEYALIRFSQLDESILVPPIAAGFVCMKASLYAVSNKMQINLRFIFTALNLICEYLLQDSSFMEYWDRVAFNFYSNEFMDNPDNENLLSLAQEVIMKGNSMYKKRILIM